MSKRNILVAFLLGAAMFAGSASADGKTKRVIKDGPCPLGTVKTIEGKCVRRVPPPAKHCPAGFVKTTTGDCIRRQVHTPKKTCPSGYMFDRNGNCIRRQVSKPRPAPVRQVSLDLSGFNGGVGANIGSGFYGGGGFVAVAPTRSFSGVTESSASVFTFNREVSKRRNRPNPRPKHNPCMMGCGGGKQGGKH